MKLRSKLTLCLGIILGIIFMFHTTTFADDIGNTGGTGQGNITGTNVYTFSYIYDSTRDAIELKVTTKNPISSFGNTNTHIYTSPSDQLVLHTQNPICGNSIENAIATMNSAGGYNLSVSDVKAILTNLGYYDKGNGVWKYNGGYLTYVSAVKIRPQVHTITYNANGGSGAPGNQTKTQGQQMFLSTKKPTCIGYTFKYWVAGIGGNYNSGQEYIHDQNGGMVTMTANWKDETAPDCSDFYAIPNYWSAENGTVGFTVNDQGSGLASVVLQRYSAVTNLWSTIKSWNYNGITNSQSEIYTENSEGVFYYKLTIKDKVGNTTTRTSSYIYLDHSNPVISGIENTMTDWINVAPVIRASATDFLNGTSYTGSGLISLVIRDDSGTVVASGTTNTSYLLTARDEGIHTWYIIATDNVGYTSSKLVTTKYDCTNPGIDGTEIAFVRPDGVAVSGYCQNNRVDQHIDDEASRSPNAPNITSGIRSVIMYRVTGASRIVIYSDSTKAIFNDSNTHTNFNMHYEITADEKEVGFYEIIVVDFAGNKTTKKLISQYSVLSWFHTSIDRSSYK